MHMSEAVDRAAGRIAVLASHVWPTIALSGTLPLYGFGTHSSACRKAAVILRDCGESDVMAEAFAKAQRLRSLMVRYKGQLLEGSTTRL